MGPPEASKGDKVSDYHNSLLTLHEMSLIIKKAVSFLTAFSLFPNLLVSVSLKQLPIEGLEGLDLTGPALTRFANSPVLTYQWEKNVEAAPSRHPKMG